MLTPRSQGDDTLLPADWPSGAAFRGIRFGKGWWPALAYS